jgi:hypothetical protein
MRSGRWYLLIVAVLFISVLTACAANANTASTQTSSSVTLTSAPSTDGTQVSGTPTVDAQALILEKLQNHHGIDRVLSAKHTREEWNATLDRMNGYGANISDAEKKIIIDYLLSR